MKTRQAIGSLAIAASLLLGGTASAQSFSFDNTVVKAPQGGTLNLGVFLSDVPQGVAAVNFTVRVSAGDAAKMDLASATSTSPQDNAEFAYAYNSSLVRSSVTTGVIQGNVVEFRGVIYPEGDTFTPFAANARTRVATLSIPIQADAVGELRFELVSAIDGETGLLGVSNSAGESLVPGGETRPFGDVKRILIQTPNVGRGDFNESCFTDLSDFLYILDNWQITTDLTDFLNLLDNWQQSCP